MAVAREDHRYGAFVVSEANFCRSRELVFNAVNRPDGGLPIGMIFVANGTIVEAGNTGLASMILLRFVPPAPLTVGTYKLVLARDAEVNDAYVHYYFGSGGAMTQGQIDAVNNALRDNSRIIVRRGVHNASMWAGFFNAFGRPIGTAIAAIGNAVGAAAGAVANGANLVLAIILPGRRGRDE